MQAPLAKIQSSGSDHVVAEWPAGATTDTLAALARRWCDRAGGEGADGVVFVGPAADGATALRIFTPDGNEPGLCVNGLLCAARYLHDRGRLTPVLLQRGVRRHVQHLGSAEFPSGGFRLESIAVAAAATGDPVRQAAWVRQRLPAAGDAAPRFLDTGTPHAVAFVDRIDEAALGRLGEAANAERAVFPDGLNFSLARATAGGGLFVRTFERGGAGLSWSCASATVAAVHAALDAGVLAASAGRWRAVTLGGLALVDRLPGGAAAYAYAADVSRVHDSDPRAGRRVFDEDARAYDAFRHHQLRAAGAPQFVLGSRHV